MPVGTRSGRRRRGVSARSTSPAAPPGAVPHCIRGFRPCTVIPFTLAGLAVRLRRLISSTARRCSGGSSRSSDESRSPARRAPSGAPAASSHRLFSRLPDPLEISQQPDTTRLCTGRACSCKRDRVGDLHGGLTPNGVPERAARQAGTGSTKRRDCYAGAHRDAGYTRYTKGGESRVFSPRTESRRR